MEGLAMNLARIIPFPTVSDDGVSLRIAGLGESLPFPAKRFFFIWSDVREVRRGGHACRHQSELIICVSGVATVTVEDRTGKRSYVLSSGACGLYVPPMTWVDVDLKKRSELLVLASDVYDEADHMTDRREFEDAHATA